MRLVFIVEGDCEIILIEKLVIPFLVNKGISMAMNVQTITTNRKQHKKGGVTNYELLRNEIKKTLSQGNVFITTFLDFYGLPTNFPSYTTDSRKIQDIENAISKDFDNAPHIIPYIQRHELESVFFSKRDGLEFVINDINAMKEVDKIIHKYPNPEDINNSPQTAPSKRLEKIFNYQKTTDSDDILDFITINDIMSKCPRFNAWIQKLITTLT